jgi:CheY-like chemotaxis protein
LVSARRIKQSSLSDSDKRRLRHKKNTAARAWDYSFPVNVCCSRFLRHHQLIFIVCQLHGGDIGVSSIDGKGSTFGFFFKARYSTAFKDGARPSGSRNNSDSPSTDRSTTSNGRPGYSRANSTLHGIKEQSESSPERPKPHMLSSYHGVDAEDMDKEMNESIVNPPTEEGTAADPAEHRDERYMETKGVVDKMKMEHVGDTELKLPDLSKGETRRQHSKAEGITKSQGKKNADVNKTLLLVEDNQINQKVLRRQLQAKGFEVSQFAHTFFSAVQLTSTQVLVANNGQEAVDAVAERGQLKADDGGDRNYFHCILMDQEMPIKSGDIATKEIRELQAQGKAGQSPILGVSANVREAQTAAMKDAGMDDVISKPFKVDDLVKRIQKLSSSESDERDDK